MPRIGVACSPLWPVVMLVVVGCGAAYDPYALRGAWRQPPHASLIAFQGHAALDGGTAIAMLSGGDVIAAGSAGWRDRGSELVVRFSPAGTRRWVRHFSACRSQKLLVAGREDDVFVAMTGLIDLEAHRTDLSGEVCDANDLARTATVLHFGPGGDVVGRIVLPDRYRGPPQLFAGATGVVAVGVVDGPPGGMAIVAIDASGRVASRHHVAGAFENQVAATRGGFVVLTELLDDQRSRRVQAFDATGATAWTTTLEGPVPHDGSGAALVAHDDRVVVTLNGEERIGLDAATGAEVWRSRADQPPRTAGAAPLQPAELITLRHRTDALGVQHVSIVALDARSGATRTLSTLDARPRPLAHGLVQGSRIVPEGFTRAGDDLWMIGLYGGRLSIGDAAVEVDTVMVRRWEDVCKVECLVAHPEYVRAGNPWEVFVARVPLVAAP